MYFAASRYDFRVSSDAETLRGGGFESAAALQSDQVLEGDLLAPQTSGSRERFRFDLTQGSLGRRRRRRRDTVIEANQVYYLAMKAENERGLMSDVSNVVSFFFYAQTTSTTSSTTTKTTTTTTSTSTTTTMTTTTPTVPSTTEATTKSTTPASTTTTTSSVVSVKSSTTHSTNNMDNSTEGALVPANQKSDNDDSFPMWIIFLIVGLVVVVLFLLVLLLIGFGRRRSKAAKDEELAGAEVTELDEPAVGGDDEAPGSSPDVVVDAEKAIKRISGETLASLNTSCTPSARSSRCSTARSSKKGTAKSSKKGTASSLFKFVGMGVFRSDFLKKVNQARHPDSDIVRFRNIRQPFENHQYSNPFYGQGRIEPEVEIENATIKHDQQNKVSDDVIL